MTQYGAIFRPQIIRDFVGRAIRFFGSVPFSLRFALNDIVLSTACYAPFLALYEKKSLHTFSTAMNELVGILKKCEETTEEVVLTECEGNAGRLAKLLATELQVSLAAASSPAYPGGAENPLLVKYQPQI